MNDDTSDMLGLLNQTPIVNFRTKTHYRTHDVGQAIEILEHTNLFIRKRKWLVKVTEEYGIKYIYAKLIDRPMKDSRPNTKLVIDTLYRLIQKEKVGLYFFYEDIDNIIEIDFKNNPVATKEFLDKFCDTFPETLI